MSCCRAIIAHAAALLLAAVTVRAQELPPDHPWPTNWPPRVHDPSAIVRDSSGFWLFSTGRNIPSRRSPDLIHWTAGPTVFAQPPAWVKKFLPAHNGWFWAPDLLRVRDRWLLYYSVSEFGKNTSAIALASNPTLDPAAKNFAWRDDGIIITSARTNDFNCIDPALFRDDDGRLWLAFGSFWSGIHLAELDPATGRLRDPRTPTTLLAHNNSIEAASLAKHGGNYFLFVNWGLCCRGTNSTYEIRVGRSGKITGPYLDRDGKDLRAGGGTEFLRSEDRFIGPGHASVLRDGTNEYVSFHFYDRDRRGAPTLGVRRLGWDAAGWPVPGAWISPASAGEPLAPAERH